MNVLNTPPLRNSEKQNYHQHSYRSKPHRPTLNPSPLYSFPINQYRISPSTRSFSTFFEEPKNKAAHIQPTIFSSARVHYPLCTEARAYMYNESTLPAIARREETFSQTRRARVKSARSARRERPRAHIVESAISIRHIPRLAPAAAVIDRRYLSAVINICAPPSGCLRPLTCSSPLGIMIFRYANLSYVRTVSFCFFFYYSLCPRGVDENLPGERWMYCTGE